MDTKTIPQVLGRKNGALKTVTPGGRAAQWCAGLERHQEWRSEECSPDNERNLGNSMEQQKGAAQAHEAGGHRVLQGRPAVLSGG